MKTIDQLIAEAEDKDDEIIGIIQNCYEPPVINPAQRIERLIDFPTRHRMTAELSGDEWLASYRNGLETAAKGGIIAIIGKRGTGKTQMAHHIAQNVTLPDIIQHAKRDGFTSRNDRPAIYRTAMDIFLELRSSYSPKAEKTEWEIFKGYENAALLVIDEITVSTGSAFEDLKITAIMDKRYQQMRPTILIGNATPSELSDRLGKSVVSRITENGIVIECNWQSYRAKNHDTRTD